MVDEQSTSCVSKRVTATRKPQCLSQRLGGQLGMTGPPNSSEEGHRAGLWDTCHFPTKEDSPHHRLLWSHAPHEGWRAGDSCHTGRDGEVTRKARACQGVSSRWAPWEGAGAAALGCPQCTPHSDTLSAGTLASLQGLLTPTSVQVGRDKSDSTHRKHRQGSVQSPGLPGLGEAGSKLRCWGISPVGPPKCSQRWAWGHREGQQAQPHSSSVRPAHGPGHTHVTYNQPHKHLPCSHLAQGRFSETTTAGPAWQLGQSWALPPGHRAQGVRGTRGALAADELGPASK